MYILAIDTSGAALSVALLEDDTIRAEIFLNTGGNHSHNLLPAIKYVYEQSSLNTDAANLFVCAIGPGSFTGLRIGVGTIKGLAMATGKPVVGVSSLEVLAANIAPVSMNICPMLDAQRGQIYTALYKMDDDFLPMRIIEEQVAELEPFLKGLTEKTVFLGSGALRHAQSIKKILPDTSIILPERHCYNRAAVAGILGLKKFKEGRTSDVLALKPRYLRTSEAERKYEALETVLKSVSSAK
jgi:tRNA threonylcarbamoyladenosine biosynthesis protein TsaB